MKSLQEIFTGNVFRIPDYQRGYSWEERQLNDLWQDIQNLKDNERPHYMGMVGAEPLMYETYSTIEGFVEDIHEGRFSFYHVVDGQQRLLTLVLLLHAIIDTLEDDEKLLGESKINLIERYFYRQDKQAQNLYKISYEHDDPSHNYLIKKIFKQESEYEIIDTVYTKNLEKAKKFFTKKVSQINQYRVPNNVVELLTNNKYDIDDLNFNALINRDFKSKADFIKAIKKVTQDKGIIKFLIEISGIKELEKLYKIVTTRLKFDFNAFEEMEISMIFETMNKRGKPLSNLEMLKNRLIYLYSILDISDSTKRERRKQVSEIWKQIYFYLGRNEKNSLDDDVFLRNHWIMYYRYTRSKAEFYVDDIFSQEFTVRSIQGNPANAKKIDHYRQSLEVSIKEWFKMFNPKHPYSHEIGLDREIAAWLYKLTIIGFKAFSPMILAAFVSTQDKNELTELLKNIEKHIFLLFHVSYRNANTGSSHFSNLAKTFFDGKLSLQNINEDIKGAWTYGTKGRPGYIDLDDFRKYIDDLFIREGTRGFLDWKTALKYFLFEYELSLTNNTDLEFRKLEVETVYPEPNGFGERPAYWASLFDSYFAGKQYEKRYKYYLTYSLGNLILVKRTRREKEQIPDMTFEERKKEVYAVGLANEQEIAQMEDWTPFRILERGLKLLKFMEERWEISFDDWYIDKTKLLNLSFLDNIEEIE